MRVIRVAKFGCQVIDGKERLQEAFDQHLGGMNRALDIADTAKRVRDNRVTRDDVRSAARFAIRNTPKACNYAVKKLIRSQRSKNAKA